MRLDHIAYRVANRQRTADFFCSAFAYRLQTEVDIQFDDGTSARCIALEPPEKPLEAAPWTCLAPPDEPYKAPGEYHLPPEIFISDGTPDSIVGRWVAARDGVGGIHHLAYQVDDVKAAMQHWRDRGYAEFSSADVLSCPDLDQVFTKPSALTGVIYELIKRGKHGFCQDNVKSLMHSTEGFK